MDEPPLKRARRTDSVAMWDKNETANGSKASPKSPRPHATDRDQKSRKSENGVKKDEDRRRKSRSPHDKHRNTRESRSPSPREKSRKERDRERTRDSDRKSRRERSRSRDRRRGVKTEKSDRMRDRSRSPHRSGESSKPVRQRSPPRSKVKTETRDIKPSKDNKSILNGNTSKDMDVDNDDLDVMIKNMMGFATFKTTQNTKVPGNQIYGVRKEKKTEYRQYMNRTGGFNRPLSPG